MEKKSSKKIKDPQFQKEDDLFKQALLYHQYPSPGKLEINATKILNNLNDLSLAYSPGVAAPCMIIAEDPSKAQMYTTRSNLVAVISNGSAVLGLGNIGPLASKPVMEGKAVLFKKFAGINVFDIEIDAKDVDTMVSTISALEPTFGGINLEDIKSPECFEVEKILSQKLKIPCFHDDQHGTAVTVTAAALNGMKLIGKKFSDIKVVTLGAGAAALACLNLLVTMGVRRENIWIHDLEGLVYKGRKRKIDQWKSFYAQDGGFKTLAETMQDADLFLGLSAAGALKPDVLKYMAPNPLIMTLANPIPEIMPDVAREIRPDAMICTGRSDFANQVNNVLCFPYIFRGALDCGATSINEAMKVAAAHAMAALVRDVPPDIVYNDFSTEYPVFGSDYLIPSPFNPNLILYIAPAVAKAAEETGVASSPIKDYEAYRDSLKQFLFPGRSLMKNIFSIAKNADLKRILFSSGEDERILRSAQILIKEKMARPVLVGSPSVIQNNICCLDLQILPEKDFDIIDLNSHETLENYVDLYRALTGEKDISSDSVHTILRSNATLVGSLALKSGEADMMICTCGSEDQYDSHLTDINKIIGKKSGISSHSAMSILVAKDQIIFFADTHVAVDPSAREIAENTVLASQAVRSFGMNPLVSLLSRSNFGSHNTKSSLKMHEALEQIRELSRDLKVDETIQGEADFSEIFCNNAVRDTSLSQDAKLLIFPNIDSANISLEMVKSITNGLYIGKVLLGSALPVHILPAAVNVREIIDMVALAIAENCRNSANIQI
ncbi:NADP-dependent malic enzyme [Candidatus Liberibacter solanacearum]|uniref:NADP-dependent malic enzyme n=1 Tax=Candidatus Liberibacter solanacearum TaxID=556287 RepID=A0A3R7Q3H5_9HYPH|nr:phosphate acyltransferase [Candidatus Liberibacter solanacearum]RPD36955.1 NADP-dependent malic enzyme [Candidatus Liberibacter solanacearum]